MKKKQKKKGGFTTVLLIIIFFVGLSLVLYPSFSNYWNSFHSSHAINQYSESISKIDPEEYARILGDAQAYNAELAANGQVFNLSDAQRERYDSLLNVSGNGMMGYIEIPSIDVSLPIYHSTDAAVLQIAAGHIDWTSLPVGGESSHCVLSGHRGLPSAKLFTDLDKLIVGDVFMLYVLDEVLTYEVDQILIVEPQEVQDLSIVHGEDYCTLVTCTPYGINTHRLLVRGRRIDNLAEEGAHVISEAVVIEPLIVAPIVALPLLILLLILVITRRPAKRKKKSVTVEEVHKSIRNRSGGNTHD